MPGQNPGTMLKLAMLGDGGVGKTALVIQLCLNQFVETYDPTIEDSYRKRILLDEHATTLELMDTAGQEEYMALQEQVIRDAEGFLLVYSVTQRSSFSRIKKYVKEIERIKDGESYGVVLVGNKMDQAVERQVSVKEGEQLAHANSVPFFETSAKMNINTEIAFLTLARLTRDNHGEPEQQHNRPSDASTSLPLPGNATPNMPAMGPNVVVGSAVPLGALPEAVLSDPRARSAEPDSRTPEETHFQRQGSYNTVPQEAPLTKLADRTTARPAERERSTKAAKKKKNKKCLVM